jgi:hypothetical protein
MIHDIMMGRVHVYQTRGDTSDDMFHNRYEKKIKTTGEFHLCSNEGTAMEDS